MALEDVAPSRAQIAEVLAGIEGESERISAVTQYINEDAGLEDRYKAMILSMVLSDLGSYS